MAENKKTFIFYSDWINMVREMDNEDAGELLKHILSYVNDENPTTDNKFVRMAFGHMKPMLKKDLDKWDNQLKKYSEMGKRSAELRKTKPNSTHVEPTLTKVERMNTVNDNVNVNVNDNVNKETLPNKNSGEIINPNQTSIITELEKEEVYDLEIYPTFNDFWELYDKKKGKPTTEKKWGKLNQKDKEIIMVYIPNYIESQKNKKYRKDPTTFLNNESWNDEIISSKDVKEQTINRQSIETIKKNALGW